MARPSFGEEAATNAWKIGEEDPQRAQTPGDDSSFHRRHQSKAAFRAVANNQRFESRPIINGVPGFADDPDPAYGLPQGLRAPGRAQYQNVRSIRSGSSL